MFNMGSKLTEFSIHLKELYNIKIRTFCQSYLLSDIQDLFLIQINLDIHEKYQLRPNQWFYVPNDKKTDLH